MGKPKIAIFIYSLDGGGAERVVSVLLPYLQKSFEVYLILMSKVIAFDLPNNLKIIFLEKSIKSENGFWKLLKIPFLALKYHLLCQKYEIALSLSFMYRPNAINIIAGSLSKKRKIIVSERSNPSKKGLFNRWIVKNLYNKTQKIIVNSKGTASILANDFFINKEKIKVIYNPLDLKKSLLSQKEFSQKNKFIFITIGRLIESKRQIDIIKAIEGLGDNVELWILGVGNERSNLENKAKELNKYKKIHFLGFRGNIDFYLKQADCFVLASEYEGFPNVIPEAMAVGLPVISTDCRSGPREILSPQSSFKKELKEDFEIAEFGILVPVGKPNILKKAMKFLMENPKKLLEFSENAREHISDLNAEEISNQYKTEILKCLGTT